MFIERRYSATYSTVATNLKIISNSSVNLQNRLKKLKSTLKMPKSKKTTSNAIKDDCTNVQIDKTTFPEMMLSENVLLGLAKNGFTIFVSHVQSRVIPLGRSSLGKKTQFIQIHHQYHNLLGFSLDLLIEINSSSGELVVISIIILEAFLPAVHKPQSLILSASRLSTVLIESSLKIVGSCTPGKCY